MMIQKKKRIKYRTCIYIFSLFFSFVAVLVGWLVFVFLLFSIVFNPVSLNPFFILFFLV